MNVAGEGDVPFRCGFVALAGRPNAGKSTLLNLLVGRHVAAVSPHPQTTRRRIRGVVNREAAQIVLVDTPGLHRPRTLLGERLGEVALGTWSEVDLVCWCVSADERVGPGDRHLAGELAAVGAPVVVAVTKEDLVDRGRLAEQLAAVGELAREVGLEVSDFVPISALTGRQVETLVEVLANLLPAGRPLFDPGDVTDQTDEQLVAELIREAALADVREELPHSIVVTVDEMGLRPDRPSDRPLFDIHATLHVERASQKGIVIGHRGERLRKTGTVARQGLERLLGVPVYLDLHVRVAREWQRDPKQLGRLGF